jgi:diguanylate cyclase (GGDEF)-like protein/PAS domain S-box-containing protein
LPDFFHFFIEPPESSLLYTGHYDPVLVTLSVLVAIFASYVALLVSPHVSTARTTKSRRLWLTLGGVTMGLGTWAMHFVGMLAFSLPCGTRYDPLITLFSMIPAILASTLALATISRRTMTSGQFATGGLLMGFGIGTMHYSGMAAMRLDGLIRYDFKLFLLSILVAVVLATLALWIRFRLRAWQTRLVAWVPAIGAVVMGLAVSGMHYTAMAAAYFISDGEKNITDSLIAPTFLASMVLATTGVIIVLTLVATYVERPNLFSVRRAYKIVGVMIAGWVAIAWLSADYYYNRFADTLYQQEYQLANRQVEQLATNIGDAVQRLKGISAVIALDDESREILRRFAPDAAVSDETGSRQRWTQDRSLVDMNRLLANVVAQLGADAVWLVNVAGDCVAASNAGTAGSFVGANFADRIYFTLASAGKNGYQYAVGRKSKTPGLYYSAPAFENGRFIGAVVSKQEITKFARWMRSMSGFVSDANGVIILASDTTLINQALPNTPIATMSEAERLQQYRQGRFATLAIRPWQPGRYPAVVLVGDENTPVLFVSRSLPEDGITLHITRPLAELGRLVIERNGLFFLLSVAGMFLIITAAAIVLYLRQVQKAETDLRILAAAFDVHEGMLITDASGVILRVNQAFVDITGYSAEEVLGHTPRILRSGRHDPEFYASMWAQIKETGGWHGEVWNRNKNGDEYPEWLTITAVKGVANEISHYVGTISDISQRKKAEDEIKYLAFYDTLTQLPNRRLLIDRLKQAMATSARNGHGGALLFIDLDNFKALNDTLGHDKGDLLLQQVAERLVRTVRDTDTVARFGGDEFVVMLENLSESADEAVTQIRTVGEKMLEVLDQPYLLAGYKHQCTSSIGATLFQGHEETLDELLKQADLAMYQAKDKGRNALHFFDQGMQAVANTRAALEADLRQSLHKDEFLLYYQPQVGHKGNLIGVEALVRWLHPQRGMVPPAQFIPLAEETGLILPLGHWVLETACMQLAAWAGRLEMASIPIAVNISARQFRHPDFVEQVMAVVERTGADAHKLKLELTESLLLEDVEDIIAKMTRLKAEGVGFSLDDFGTGYSSLAYLKRLPLDQLKIDQSFVQDVLTDPNDAAIARTIVALAQSLGLSVIAEGVETEAQRDFLADAECYAYQGYLYGRPGPVADIVQFSTLPSAD